VCVSKKFFLNNSNSDSLICKNVVFTEFPLKHVERAIMKFPAAQHQSYKKKFDLISKTLISRNFYKEIMSLQFLTFCNVSEVPTYICTCKIHKIYVRTHHLHSKISGKGKYKGQAVTFNCIFTKGLIAADKASIKTQEHQQVEKTNAITIKYHFSVGSLMCFHGLFLNISDYRIGN